MRGGQLLRFWQVAALSRARRSYHFCQSRFGKFACGGRLNQPSAARVFKPICGGQQRWPEQTIDFSRSEALRAAFAEGYSAAGHVSSVLAGLYAHQALTYFDLSND